MHKQKEKKEKKTHFFFFWYWYQVWWAQMQWARSLVMCMGGGWGEDSGYHCCLGMWWWSLDLVGHGCDV
jgi:hypothetical protein